MRHKQVSSFPILGIILCAIFYASVGRSQPIEVSVEHSATKQKLTALRREIDELFDTERFDEALTKAERQLSLSKSIYQPPHSEISDALNNVGSARAELENFPAALDALQQAYKMNMQLTKDEHGKDWLAAADDMNQLAWVAWKQGKYELSLSHNSESLRMRLLANPAAPDKVVESYNNIGDNYNQLGQYYKAQEYLRKTVDYLSQKEPLSTKHAISRNNLADIYTKLARYNEAVSEQLLAISIGKSALKDQPSEMGTLYATLGNIYRASGAYELAEQQYLHALEYVSPTAQEQSAKSATVHHNLGVIYQYIAKRSSDRYLTQRYFSNAKMHLDISLKTRQALFSKEPHPDVAHAYDGLATLYKAMGAAHYEDAMLYQQRAVKIFTECFARTPQHPDLNGALFHQAQLLEARALVIEFARAQEALVEAARIYDKVLQSRRSLLLDDDHPSVIEARHRLAMVHASQGNLVQAISELEQNLEKSENLLHRVLGGFGEARVAEFLRVLRDQEEEVYALLQHHQGATGLILIALQTTLLRKGLSLELSAERSRIVQSAPSMSPAAAQLRDARSELASLELGEPPDPEKTPLTILKRRLERRTELRQRIVELDDQLAQSVGTTAVPRNGLAPKSILSRIADRLPPDGALIDIVAFCPNCVDRAGTEWAQLHYLAFLLIPDAQKGSDRQPHVELFDLGQGRALAQAFERFSAAVSTNPASRTDADLDPKKWGQELYRRIMQPIVSKLGNRQKLFLIPDGLFHHIPFAALHDGESYLIKSFEFVYLNSGRELLRESEGSGSQLSVTVLADPEFTTASNQMSGCGGSPVASRSLQEPPEWQVRHFALRGNRPPESLPGTCQEAKFIQSIWPWAQILLGRAATERALRDTISPGVLHISTHAAFLGASSAAMYATARHGSMEMELAAQDPLLQSMLLLAKVDRQRNQIADSQQNQKDWDDGIATALEVASMKLQGTQLVVLPDCDSALGQITRGEGVYGLRSAFLIAGAETLIASLWKVNDETAPEMIAALYANLLKGKTRLEALHLALQSVRRTHPDPYFWGSLVLVGQAGKLRGIASTPPQIPSLPPPCRARVSPLWRFSLSLFLCGALAMGILVRRRVLSRGD